MGDAINAMSDAFRSLSDNTAIVPSRINLPIEDQNALHLSMPAYVKGGKYIMIKLVNVHYDNPRNDLPLINGIILLMDSTNGVPLAFMDGKSITALRTGASSGLATKILSNQNSRTAVVIGTGVQALSQIEAIQCVRDLNSIKVIGRDINKVEKFCSKLDSSIQPGNKSSLKEADIICTATTSKIPLFNYGDIKKGVHINAVGAHQSNTRELDTELIQKAKVYIDHLDPSKNEAGDILIPISEGAYKWEDIQGELGSLVEGKIKGRVDDTDITVFNSIGNAVQDLAIASLVIEKKEN